MKTAVVVGALGVIGSYIVDALAALPDWQVIGLSRRKGVDRERVRYVSVDLLEPFEPDFGGVTHVNDQGFACFLMHTKSDPDF